MARPVRRLMGMFSRKPRGVAAAGAPPAVPKEPPLFPAEPPSPVTIAGPATVAREPRTPTEPPVPTEPRVAD